MLEGSFRLVSEFYGRVRKIEDRRQGIQEAGGVLSYSPKGI
jgi:hypothetical protein